MEMLRYQLNSLCVFFEFLYVPVDMCIFFCIDTEVELQFRRNS
jgi:hypothetical protein